MRNIYKGSCLCGGVRFSVSGFSEQVANCHCSMCRKFHGAAFGTLVGVKDLIWQSGEQLLSDFVAPNGATRTFCRDCGSSLGFRVKDMPLTKIEIAVATFDSDIPIAVKAQIYTAFKANWCDLDKDIPVFDEARIS